MVADPRRAEVFILTDGNSIFEEGAVIYYIGPVVALLLLIVWSLCRINQIEEPKPKRKEGRDEGYKADINSND